METSNRSFVAVQKAETSILLKALAEADFAATVRTATPATMHGLVLVLFLY